jgi:hypothetical protein
MGEGFRTEGGIVPELNLLTVIAPTLSLFFRGAGVESGVALEIGGPTGGAPGLQHPTKPRGSPEKETLRPQQGQITIELLNMHLITRSQHRQSDIWLFRNTRAVRATIPLSLPEQHPNQIRPPCPGLLPTPSDPAVRALWELSRRKVAHSVD